VLTKLLVYSSRVSLALRWKELKEPKKTCAAILFPIVVPSEASKDDYNEDNEI